MRDPIRFELFFGDAQSARNHFTTRAVPKGGVTAVEPALEIGSSTITVCLSYLQETPVHLY